MAKKRATLMNNKREHILGSGDKVLLSRIAPGMIQEALGKVEEPVVPMWMNPEKGREEENPTDAEYLKQLKEFPNKQIQAMLDVAVLFGVQFVNGLPPDEEWIPKIQYAEKLGHIDLSEYDLDIPIEKEFVYKKFVAFSAEDFDTVSNLSGITEEMVAEATNGFRDKEE